MDAHVRSPDSQRATLSAWAQYRPNTWQIASDADTGRTVALAGAGNRSGATSAAMRSCFRMIDLLLGDAVTAADGGLCAGGASHVPGSVSAPEAASAAE